MIPLTTSSVESDRSSSRGGRFAIRLACQLLAVIGGAAIFAPPFGYLGSTVDRAMLGIDLLGTRTIIGIGVGAIIGAVLGCGLLNGFIGSLVIWIVGLAVFFAMLGPGCDADPVSSALVGAALGLFLGLTKWRGLAILVAMLLALNIAGPGGLGLATILGIYVVYRVLRFQWVSAETGPKNADGSRNQRMPARQRQRSG